MDVDGKPWRLAVDGFDHARVQAERDAEAARRATRGAYARLGLGEAAALAEGRSLGTMAC